MTHESHLVPCTIWPGVVHDLNSPVTIGETVEGLRPFSETVVIDGRTVTRMVTRRRTEKTVKWREWECRCRCQRSEK